MSEGVPDLHVGRAVLRGEDGLLVGPHGKTFLGPQESMLLRALEAADGKIVLHERLFALLWGSRPDGAPLSRVIPVVMCRLRRKLAVVGAGVGPVPAWRVGYRLTPPDGVAVRLLTARQTQLLDDVLAAAKRVEPALVADFLRAAS